MYYWPLDSLVLLGVSFKKSYRGERMAKLSYRISSSNHRSVYLILRLLVAAFISNIKIEENEIMYQFKTIRSFVNHAV